MPKSGRPLARPLLVLGGFLVGMWCGASLHSQAPPHAPVEPARSPAASASADAREEADSPSWPAFDFPPGTTSVVINVGSNLGPIMPTREMGPCARGVAVEPVVACSIPPHPQLHVLPAAVSAVPGVTSMRIMNSNGVSSSLADPASEMSWNNNKERDGKTVLVPVVTLSSIVRAVPESVAISVLMTDMQGFDFVAVREAADVLRERAPYIVSEVWLDDVYTYRAENDLCRDWLPLMKGLGYALQRLQSHKGKAIGAKTVAAKCEKQMRERPERPAPDASAGLRESNAYWVRDDAPGTAFPEVSRAGVEWTDRDYASCSAAPSRLLGSP
mmetsp:Transcript_7738/g.28062  ORF Transcript_7738/g.28062 Transcript_7738/m.28062 type:complete len:329 (+) Transcript_7738:204-1190(+)